MDDETCLDNTSTGLERQAIDNTDTDVVMDTSDKNAVIFEASMEESSSDRKNEESKAKKKKRKKRSNLIDDQATIANNDTNKSNGPLQKQVNTPETKKEAKKAARELLSNPDKILKSVLEKTSYKLPNLSLAVTQKYNEPDFRHEVRKAMSKIRYADMIESAQIQTSVLPSRFDHERFRINLDQAAITSLTCIYQKPERKFNRRDKRKGYKRRNQGSGPKKDDKIGSNFKGNKDDRVVNGAVESTSMMTDDRPTL